MSSEKQIARSKFENVFGKISTECLDYLTKNGMPNEAIEWFKSNLNYNVPGGKLNRGMSVVDTYQILKNDTLSDEEYERAAILGWCIELVCIYKYKTFQKTYI